MTLEEPDHGGILAIESGPTIDCDGCRITVCRDGVDVDFYPTESDAALLIRELTGWLEYRAGLRADVAADAASRRATRRTLEGNQTP